jgi:DNA-directed RNA polymerase subunit F
MVRKIIEENLISIPEVKDIMDDVIKRMSEAGEVKLDAFQEATYEYVTNFSKMPAKNARKIIDALVKQYNMDVAVAIQVVNIDPKYIEELRVIFEKDPQLRTLSDKELTEIVEFIKDSQ